MTKNALYTCTLLFHVLRWIDFVVYGSIVDTVFNENGGLKYSHFWINPSMAD